MDSAAIDIRGGYCERSISDQDMGSFARLYADSFQRRIGLNDDQMVGLANHVLRERFSSSSGNSGLLAAYVDDRPAGFVLWSAYGQIEEILFQAALNFANAYNHTDNFFPESAHGLYEAGLKGIISAYTQFFQINRERIQFNTPLMLDLCQQDFEVHKLKEELGTERSDRFLDVFITEAAVSPQYVQAGVIKALVEDLERKVKNRITSFFNSEVSRYVNALPSARLSGSTSGSVHPWETMEYRAKNVFIASLGKYFLSCNEAPYANIFTFSAADSEIIEGKKQAGLRKVVTIHPWYRGDESPLTIMVKKVKPDGPILDK